MREVLPTIDEWQQGGNGVALATVIKTWGSAPRKRGAKMALTEAGKMVGSVSGGCVEGAVIEAGIDTLSSGQPQLLHFGVADETAWSVGLACGGEIDVFVEPLRPDVAGLVREWLARDGGGVIMTVIQAGEEGLAGRKLLVSTDGTVSGSVSRAVDETLAARAQEILATRHAQRFTLEEGELDVFADVILPPPALVIVGGGHISVALARLAHVLNFRTVVVEPRRAFANEERFPEVDQLLNAWPKKGFEEIAVTPTTAVAVLTHDPKIDDPALEVALASPMFYIGALGSTRTQAKRRQRFLDKGFSEEKLDRIRGPIGLNINAQTPEEIALAIMAEVVAVYRSGE